MLVLTRKLMERLYIGEDICVTVVRLEGGQVRLGIEAPRSVAVVRAELLPDGGRALQEAAGHKEQPDTAGAQRKAGFAASERPAKSNEMVGAGVTPRSAGVPGIGNRLRGPSR